MVTPVYSILLLVPVALSQHFGGSLPDFLPFSSHDAAAFARSSGGIARNRFLPPPRFSVDLFTPNTAQQPAETAGQLSEYAKALREIEEEDRSQEAAAPRQEAPQARTYVNVNFRGGNDTYAYNYFL